MLEDVVLGSLTKHVLSEAQGDVLVSVAVAPSVPA